MAGLREVEGAELALGGARARRALAPAQARRSAPAPLQRRRPPHLRARARPAGDGGRLRPDRGRRRRSSGARGGGARAVAVDVDVAIMLGAEADVLLDDAPLGVWTYRHGLGRERADDVPYLRDVKERRLREPRRARAPVRPGRARALDDQDRSRLDAARPQRGAAALPPPRGPAAARSAATAPSPSRRSAAPETAVPAPRARRRRGALERGPHPRAPAPAAAVQHALARAVAARRPAGRGPARRRSASSARASTGPPRGRDWADPFPVRVNGRSWLFFEEIPWRGGRGHISVAELDEDGDLHDQRVVLATPHHLSYPFVFKHEGRTICCRSRAPRPPRRCIAHARSRTTGSRCACSPTMRCTTRRSSTRMGPGGCSARSPTWASPRTTSCTSSTPTTLEGPWHPHPRNPVVSDVRGARPARAAHP